MKQNLHTKAVFRIKTGFIRNGVRHLRDEWSPNLILDSGLDKVGSLWWARAWTTCLFGDKVAPTEVRRDSALITFTTSGTACTASGNFFTSADVGRLIKFNDGTTQERYITAFTDAQHVTLGIAPSPVIGGVSATIWYVNQTALEHLHSATNTYGSNGGDNGTSWLSNVVTMKRTFVGGAVGAPVTLTEIGFSESGTNANIFDRDLIPGGVALSSGDQPLAVCELILTLNPITPLAVPNVGTGFNAAGTTQFSRLTGTISEVDSNGNFGSGNSFNDPRGTGALASATGSFTFPTFGSPTAAPAFASPDAVTSLSYSNGTFFRDLKLDFLVSTSNGTVYGIILRDFSNFIWGVLFTTPFVKTSLQIMSFTLRKSWQRVLTN